MSSLHEKSAELKHTSQRLIKEIEIIKEALSVKKEELINMDRQLSLLVEKSQREPIVKMIYNLTLGQHVERPSTLYFNVKVIESLSPGYDYSVTLYYHLMKHPRAPDYRLEMYDDKKIILFRNDDQVDTKLDKPFKYNELAFYFARVLLKSDARNYKLLHEKHFPRH